MNITSNTNQLAFKGIYAEMGRGFAMDLDKAGKRVPLSDIGEDLSKLSDNQLFRVNFKKGRGFSDGIATYSGSKFQAVNTHLNIALTQDHLDAFSTFDKKKQVSTISRLLEKAGFKFGKLDIAQMKNIPKKNRPFRFLG